MKGWKIKHELIMDFPFPSFMSVYLFLTLINLNFLFFFWMIKGFKKSTGLPDVKKDMRWVNWQQFHLIVEEISEFFRFENMASSPREFLISHVRPDYSVIRVTGLWTVRFYFSRGFFIYEHYWGWAQLLFDRKYFL